MIRFLARSRSASIRTAVALIVSAAGQGRSYAQHSPSTNDAWDIHSGVTITADSGVAAGFDIRDLLGGQYSQFEPGDTVFSDSQPTGFVHFVEWRTPVPVTVSAFALFAVGDGSVYGNQREFAQLTLKAKSAGSSGFDQVLFTGVPTHPYAFVDPTNPALFVTNLIRVTAQEYRAEFVQYPAGRGIDGPRVIEIDGFSQDCVPAPSEMVAWWPGEGSAHDLLENHHGVLSNGVAFAAGQVGQAFSFDGTNDSVRIDAASDLDVGVGGGLTIEGWIRPADPLAIQPLVEWNDGLANLGTHFWINAEHPPGAIRALYANLVDTQGGTHAIGTGPGLIKADRWQHVALTYSKASGMAVLYLDGLPVQTESLGSFTPRTSFPLWLGIRAAGPGSWLGPYRGLMDEVSVYSRALSAAEIQAIRDAGDAGKCPDVCTTSPPGLVGWWPGNGSANDLAGGGPGTLVNGAGFAPAKVGHGFVFDGLNQAVVVPYSAPLVSSNFTLEAWVKPFAAVEDIDGQELIFGQGNGAQLLVRPGSTGLRATVAFRRTDLAYVGASSTIEIPTNSYSHVVGTWDGAVVRVYINGDLQGEHSPGGQLLTNSHPLFIGGFLNAAGYTGQFFKGIVDEASVYSRTLAPSEVEALFRAGSAGKCAPASPAITSGPASQSAILGREVTFRVFATGAAPLSFQWFFGTNAIPGATNESLILTNVVAEAAGDYHVEVTNLFGQAASSVAVLTVLFPPVISAQPRAQTVLIGSSATFSVEAAGTEPLAYQWRRDGISIQGATAPILVIGNARQSNVGTYTVRVSNDVGAVVSDPAPLRLASGQLTLHFTPDGPRLDVVGEVGGSYSIEYTAGFGSWSTLASFLNMPTNWFFTDQTAGAVDHRFYRLRKSP